MVNEGSRALTNFRSYPCPLKFVVVFRFVHLRYAESLETYIFVVFP